MGKINKMWANMQIKYIWMNGIDKSYDAIHHLDVSMIQYISTEQLTSFSIFMGN